MKNKILNIGLKNDLKVILENPGNVSRVEKGTVSGFSIEVYFKEEMAFSSYVYYEDQKLRDADFDELQRLIKDGK
jgi:hypothetical protein